MADPARALRAAAEGTSRRPGSAASLAALLVALAVVTQAAAAAAALAPQRGTAIQRRSGLRSVFGKLSRGEPVVVAYFGGSITAGAGASEPRLCYRERFTQHLREQFPEARVTEVNAALGGTGSWLGAFRVRRDVLSKRPDLVLVEFAVNDGGSTERRVTASMEGIVRQILKTSPATDLLFVYTLVKGHLDAYRAGTLPETVRWHERVAAHYGIPSVNMAMQAAARIEAGELTVDEFARDGVHPTDQGHALYLEALKPLVRQEKAAARRQETPSRATALPPPLSDRNLEHARMVPADQAQLGPYWERGQNSPAGHFPSVIASNVPGATLILDFRGDTIGYFDVIGPDTGDLEYALDGGPWQPRPNWDAWCESYYRPHCRIIAEGLDPRKPHRLKLRVAHKKPEKSNDRFARIGYFLVNGGAP